MKTGSICVSDIPKDKLRRAKNGKLYLNITVWVNDDVDRYGNHESIQVSQTKEEREAKASKIYLGNLKDWDREEDKPEVVRGDDESDLPF